jgi:hypothetical protein
MSTSALSIDGHRACIYTLDNPGPFGKQSLRLRIYCGRF